LPKRILMLFLSEDVLLKQILCSITSVTLVQSFQ
jgi:hypothetical protein